MTDRLRALSDAGVAIWLDDLSRQRLRSGNLANLVRDHAVVGVTSNPTIFAKALADAEGYEEQLTDLRLRGTSVDESTRLLTAADVREACDLFRPVYDATDGLDGRVSLEVDPRLAYDTAKTVAEARALWWLVDRPNVMIKIPATEAGIPAIAQALAEGISVNVTLIFALDRYRQVMEACVQGLERARAAGLDVAKISSVASFFVSRVDTETDSRLDKIGSKEALALRGKAAVANARLAFEAYEKIFSPDNERWARLAAAGARPQRPLWASTGVKNPEYPDTMYVDDLIVAGTVNTMPEATLKAVADHGVIKTDAVRGTYEEARAVMAGLSQVGVEIDEVTQALEAEGVEKFEASWAELTETIKTQLATVPDEA
jgi:transaldolase